MLSQIYEPEDSTPDTNTGEIGLWHGVYCSVNMLSIRPVMVGSTVCGGTPGFILTGGTQLPARYASKSTEMPISQDQRSSSHRRRCSRSPLNKSRSNKGASCISRKPWQSSCMVNPGEQINRPVSSLISLDPLDHLPWRQAFKQDQSYCKVL